MKLRIDVAIIIDIPGDQYTEHMIYKGFEWARNNLPKTDALGWSTTEVERSDDGYLP